MSSFGRWPSFRTRPFAALGDVRSRHLREAIGTSGRLQETPEIGAPDTIRAKATSALFRRQ